MKKRRQNHTDKNQHPDLERFDDGYNPNNTENTASESGGQNRNGGGGGGMSRAAMKRAKKRAKTASAAAASAASVSSSSLAAAAETTASTKNNDGNKQTKKMQLPLDDVDDDDNDGGGGGEDLMGALQKFRMEKTTKKKKKKKKSKKDVDGNTIPNEGETVGKASNAESSLKEEEPMMDVEEDDGSMEMEPELEALLSTLTPLQILLLDDTNGNRDETISSIEQPPNQKNDESDVRNQHEDDANVPIAAAADDDDDDGALAGIDPLHLVGDLTTEHRARILLSSLLSPSGVTLHQFYDRYWGKRPLLACLDLEEEADNDDDEEAGNTAPNKKRMGREEAEGASIARHVHRLNGFLDRPNIDEMIRRNKLRYGLDLNVTRYTDATGSGVRRRITLDPPPKKRKRAKGSNAHNDAVAAAEDDLEYVVANPRDVWSNVDVSHCTLRLLRPHEHDDNVHALLSLLESEFGCMVGSNAYLTPLHSQGFAPHYDDVDVFVLQLEGYKRWRVYAPFRKGETLPRESSRDYSEREVEENGDGPLMDVVLGPGDVLYLPRGWIHQAETVGRPSHVPKVAGIKDDHSLHLTVSAMQNWCWADFLEMLLPEALESAASSDKSISLREGLPRNFLSYMGTMHQLTGDGVDGVDENAPEGLKQAAEAQARAAEMDGGEALDEEAETEARTRRRTLARQKRFRDEAKKRIMRVCKQASAMLDDACDRIGQRFLSDRLPPALLAPERSLTKEALSDNNGNGGGAGNHHDASKKIWPNTLCRLVRPSVARLVVEDDKAVIYHCLDNSRVYHGTPVSPMEFEIDDAPALEQLLTTVEPHWIMVKDLIHGDVEDKMGIAQALFDEGLLATILVETPDRSVQTG